MLSMNLYRILMVAVFGVMAVANVVAYDDIYGSDESRSSRRKNKTDREEVAASSKSETGRDAIILKSKNLQKYELTSNNTVFITDTTIKGGDYFSDTIRVLDENGDLEKTLVLKTKVQQNVSFDNGSIVVEDPSEGENEVAEAVYYADSDDDYTYTQRLNKYHGTDYNVVSDDEETVSLDGGTTSTTIVLASPYYYPSYYDPFYDPYWNDPFYWNRPYWTWNYGYWGGWGCHSYAYHPVPHHHFEPAPVPHHSTLRPSGRNSFVSGRNSGRASTDSRTLTRSNSNFSGGRSSSSVRSSNSTVQRSSSNSGVRSSSSYNSGVRTSGSSSNVRTGGNYSNSSNVRSSSNGHSSGSGYSSSTRSSYYGGNTRTGSTQSSSVRSGVSSNVRSSAGSSSRGSYYNSGTRSSSPSSGVRSNSGSSRSSFSGGSSRGSGFSGGGVRSSGGGRSSGGSGRR